MVKKTQHDRNKRQIKNLKRENKNTKDALEILKKPLKIAKVTINIQIYCIRLIQKRNSLLFQSIFLKILR